MKAFLRILAYIVGGLAALLVLLVGGFAAAIAIDARSGRSASDYANASFTAADGTTVAAYLAQPEGVGAYPAVLMVHE